MIRNENIICISSIDWDFVWQAHQEIMSTFARNGNRVLFIENTGVRIPNFKDFLRLKKRFINWLKSAKGFREETKNLYIYSPLILPFPYSRIARWLNRHLLLSALKRWMKVAEFHEPIIWTFLPTGTALDIINNIEKKLLIYYCVANFYELVDNPKKVKKTEDELIRECDLVFAQGKELHDKCSRLNNNVHIFSLGVKFEVFKNFQHDPDKIPVDIKEIKKPIIGYIGGIHKHVDLGLLRDMVEMHPEWSIVLIGPSQINLSQLAGLKNIFLLGEKDFSSLPSYISEFNVGIIPYKLTGYTATVYPNKLNEYHAMGIPVVSTDLPEIANFNRENHDLVFVGKTHKEFIDCIERALNNRGIDLINQRIASARKNSWSLKIEGMSKLIESAIKNKSRGGVDWRNSLLKFYRRSRLRLFNLSAIFLSLYLLVFYTPIVWFVAEPLRISQFPQKADCIVVFAGGVGESGKPGQGYEERVQYAVELYKKGFSHRMIFSSGYKYVFEESAVMKALAVSLGIPGEVIILEDKASNTYENVKFVKNILDKEKWNKILLVSSPYHILRASLIMKKLIPQIKVIYTPIPESHFYSHGYKSEGVRAYKQINLQQIRALIHEYLGILYYLWKGYI